MELPIEKQFQIMYALRRGFSIRETSQLCNVPKSTVQNYKKHGPPYFRRFKKIFSIEQYPASLQEENEFLKKAIPEVLKQAKQAIDQRNIANKIVADLTVIKNLNEREIEKQKQEKEKLQKTVTEQQDLMPKMKQDHQQELENQKNNFTKYKAKMEQDHQGELEEQKNTISVAMEEKRKQDAQKFETERSIYEEQTKSLKTEIQKLNEEVNASYWKGVGVGAAGGGIVGVLGTLWYQKYVSSRSNAPRLVIVDSRKTITGTPVIPVGEIIRRQPEIHYSNSGATLVTNISGILCSGFNNYTVNTGFQYDAIPSEPQIVISGIQDIISGITPEMNSFSTVSPGIISGYSVAPIQQDGINQPVIYNRVTPVTTSDLSSSGSFISYVPYYSLTPSSNPSDSYILQQFYQTSGRGFEVIMKEFFEPPYQNNDVELTPASRDGGVDLIVRPRFWGSDKTVVELKLWKEKKVGPDVIEKIFKAMKDHEANHALVITPGEFTKPALERAKELGVDCWDGRKFLEELYKHQYFKSPT